MLLKRGITLEVFFNYAAKQQWRAFDGFPPVKFLSSVGFVNQAASALRGRVRTAYREEAYLERIVSRLDGISFPLSAEHFEDSNWTIGEAIFEPLAGFMNNSEQLKTFVARVIEDKDESALGFYVVTYDGKLTPLAVYWIVYASSHMKNSFCSASRSWRDIVREVASDVVNLSILEAQL